MKTNRLVLIAVLLCVILGILQSCGPKYIHNDLQKVNDQGWDYAEVLKFPFTLNDTSISYDLILEVDHSDEFKSQNLYVRIHTIQPSARLEQAIVSLSLADQTGRWLGKCRGHQCRVDIMLQENFKITTPGRYRIEIEQYMREKLITGVEGFRLKVIEHQD